MLPTTGNRGVFKYDKGVHTWGGSTPVYINVVLYCNWCLVGRFSKKKEIGDNKKKHIKIKAKAF